MPATCSHKTCAQVHQLIMMMPGRAYCIKATNYTYTDVFADIYGFAETTKNCETVCL